MGISEDIIERRIRDDHNLTFGQYREKVMGKIKVKLVQTAIDMALNNKNTVMMIFCLKNICGWADKIEHVEDKKGEARKLIISFDDK